jgi:hypothetical protein
LGAIVAYWDDIKAAVSGVSEEQNKLNKASSDNLKTQQDKLKAIGDQDNILKLQGKSEREILEIKKKVTEDNIAAAKVTLQNNIATAKAQLEAAQRNKDILKGTLEFLTAPIALLLKTVDAVGNALGKNFGLEEGFYGNIAKLVFDPEDVKKKGDETIKESEKLLKDLENQRAGFQLSIQQIDRDAAKKSNEERMAFEKEYTKFLQDENERRRRLRMDDFDKERIDIDKKYSDLIAKAKKYGKDTTEIEGLRFQETKDLINKATVEEIKVTTETNAKKLGDFSAMVPKMAAVTTTITANEAVQANTRKQIAEDEANNRILLAQSVGQTLGALSDVVGKETAAGKALAIAQATINTFLGITEVWKAKSVLPEPFNTASKIAATITTAAGGFAAVRNIAKTQIPGGGGGGGSVGNLSAPITPQLAPQVTATAVNTAAVNQLGNQATRAYVLNSDIQNNEQRNAYINRNASIG